MVAQQKLKPSGNRVMAPFLVCCCLTKDVKNATISSSVISQYLTKREQQAYHIRGLASIIIHIWQVESIAFNTRYPIQWWMRMSSSYTCVQEKPGNQNISRWCFLWLSHGGRSRKVVRKAKGQRGVVVTFCKNSGPCSEVLRFHSST